MAFVYECQQIHTLNIYNCITDIYSRIRKSYGIEEMSQAITHKYTHTYNVGLVMSLLQAHAFITLI